MGGRWAAAAAVAAAGFPTQAGGTAAAGGRQAGGRRAAAAAVAAAGFRPGPRRRRMAGPPSLRTSLSLPPSRLLFPSFPVLHRRLLERRRLSESLSLYLLTPLCLCIEYCILLDLLCTKANEFFDQTSSHCRSIAASSHCRSIALSQHTFDEIVLGSRPLCSSDHTINRRKNL